MVTDRVPAESNFLGQYHAIDAILNPILFEGTGSMAEVGANAIDFRANDGECIRVPPRIARTWAGSTRASPSAWNMHLTQPPTTRVTVVLSDWCYTGAALRRVERTTRKVVVKSGGIRFGDAMEAYGAFLGTWVDTMKAADPAWEAGQLMDDAVRPELSVLFESAQKHTGNAVLFADPGEVRMVQSRAERVATGN